MPVSRPFAREAGHRHGPSVRPPLLRVSVSDR